MSQRLRYNTIWLWCLLALHTDSIWGQPRPITVRTPPSNPSTIEAQAKFFQDFFSVQLSPYKIEFGHVCEDPNTWEQRYEKKDFKNHRDMGKVRWGDKKGGYGEHYWDLNHAGHSDNHEDDGYHGDDGSYHDTSNNDPYDEPSHHAPTYGTDDYDPEKSSYEETGRAKRHHPKVKLLRKQQKQSETYEEESKPQKSKRKNKEELESAATHQDEEYVDDEEEEYYEKPKPKRRHYKKHDDNQNQQHKKLEADEENDQAPNAKDKKQFVLVVSHKDDAENLKQQHQPQYSTRQHEQRQNEQNQYTPKQAELSHYVVPKQADLTQYLPKTDHQFVPYEGGAGVRQHQQPEVSAATTVPRLFLEPSTGHVVDRATGQAYVLQPIASPKNY